MEPYWWHLEFQCTSVEWVFLHYWQYTLLGHLARWKLLQTAKLSRSWLFSTFLQRVFLVGEKKSILTASVNQLVGFVLATAGCSTEWNQNCFAYVWILGRRLKQEDIYSIQMEFHHQRCPFGTDCFLSREMMLVAHCAPCGDGFERIQTYCLAWIPVEHIAGVMAMQASLANMKTELMPLASKSTLLST